jgi:hypothetical protein
MFSCPYLIAKRLQPGPADSKKTRPTQKSRRFAGLRY